MLMNFFTFFKSGLPMALGPANLSTLTLCMGTVACFPGWLLYSIYTLLRSPEAVFKRRLIGVLEHPSPPPPLGTPLLLTNDLVAVQGKHAER